LARRAVSLLHEGGFREIQGRIVIKALIAGSLLGELAGFGVLTKIM